MYNRYWIDSSLADLMEQFRIDRIDVIFNRETELEPRAQVPVVHRMAGGQRSLNGHRWGLMPYWGKQSIHTDRLTVREKPYLRYMLMKKRCVIPCSGFSHTEDNGNIRTRYRVTYPGQAVFGIAGIFDVWLDSDKNEYPMCTVVTTGGHPGETGRPLALDSAWIEEWLNPSLVEPEHICELLQSVPDPEYDVQTRREPIKIKA